MRSKTFESPTVLAPSQHAHNALPKAQTKGIQANEYLDTPVIAGTSAKQRADSQGKRKTKPRGRKDPLDQEADALNAESEDMARHVDTESETQAAREEINLAPLQAKESQAEETDADFRAQQTQAGSQLDPLIFSQTQAPASWQLADLSKTLPEGLANASPSIASGNAGWTMGTLGMIGAGVFMLGAVGLSSGKKNDGNTPTPEPLPNGPRLLTVRGASNADTVELGFDVPLDPDHLPLASQFTVSQGGQTFAVDSLGLIGGGYILSIHVHGDLQPLPFSLRYQDASGRDDQLAIQSLAGDDAASFEQGLVADGPIMGARIHIDANRNGVAEDAEFTGVTTDIYGRYILSNASQTGPIIATGGFNVDTGIANTMTLLAPEGSTVINPITTLVQSLTVHQGLSVAQASSQLAAALGLPTDLDLSRFDPFGAESGLRLAGQRIAAQVATLVHTVSQATEVADPAAVMTQLAQALVNSTGATGATLLAQPALLQTLLDSAQVPDIEQVALKAEITTAIGRIESAPTISGISNEQSLALDTVAPAAPTIKMVLTSALNEAPKVIVGFKTTSTDGTAAVAGDIVTVKLGESAALYTHTLTQSDIQNGTVSVDVPMDSNLYKATATLTDKVGLVSAVGIANAADTETVELANLLGQPIQLMMQALANQEVPLIGPQTELVESIWELLQDLLSSLPAAYMPEGESTPVVAQGVMLMSAAETTEPVTLLAAADSSSEVKWVTEGEEDIYELPVVPDENPYGEDPTPQTPENAETPVTPPNDKPVTLIGRNTGEQFDIPELNMDELKQLLKQSFHMNVKTGEFEFSLKLPFRIKQWDMLGKTSMDSLIPAEIDASLDSYVQLEINLEGMLNANKFMVFDTEKTKIELTVDAGLKEGSSVAMQLGPVVLAASDLDSARIATDAKRQNTGITGAIGVYLVDNDASPTDKKMEFNVDTFAKWFEAVSKFDTFKFSDWYALKAELQGQLSIQTMGQLDLAGIPLDGIDWAGLAKDMGLSDAFVNSATSFDQFETQMDSLLGIMSPQITSKILVPLSVSYDSTNPTAAWTSEYGKVYFDDIRLGVQTLVTDTMGPGLDLLDKVMSPLYMVEDFMTDPLPWPVLENVFGQRYDAPNDWLDVIEKIFEDVVNAPATAVETLANDLRASLDENGDGDITLFEAIRSSVNGYAAMAKEVAEFWEKFNQIPGIEGIMKAANAAMVAAGAPPLVDMFQSIMTSIAASVASPTVATPDNPNRWSPIDKVQNALDMTEDVLKAVAQLQSLRGLYEGVQDDLAQLTSNGESALSISLGSYALDIVNDSFNNTRNPYQKKSIDFNLPSADRDVKSMTQEEAIKLIYQEVKAGTASVTSLSAGVFERAGVDFTKVTEFKDLEITTGVNSTNLKVICEILNAQKSTTFDKDWSQDSLYSNGTLISSDTTSIVNFTKSLSDIVHYNRLERLTTVGDFKGWDATTMGDTLFKLGVISADDRVKQDGSGWDWSVGGYVGDNYKDYKYGGRAATYILYDIFKAQSFSDIDSLAELKALWETEKNIEDLMANQTVGGNIRGWEIDNPDDLDLDDDFLTFKEFELIGLPILSGSDGVLKAANEAIRDWSYDGYWSNSVLFDKLYDVPAEIINKANLTYNRIKGTDGDALADQALSKIMNLAAQDDGGAGDVGQLSETDFLNMGLGRPKTGVLPMLSSILASSNIKSTDVNTVENIRALLNAITTVLDTANDVTVDANKFYDAIAILLGFDNTFAPYTTEPDNKHTWAEVLSYIPRANQGGIDKLSDNKNIPLLQSVLARLSESEVDSHAELMKLAKVIKDIELTTMKDDKVWPGKYDNNPRGMDSTVIKAFKDYTPTLTQEDLQLIGYKNMNDVTEKAIRDALSKFNSSSGGAKTTYYYDESGGNSYTKAAALKNLDIDALDRVVGDYSYSGFLIELMAKSPAFKEFWMTWRDMGFDMPFLSDPAFITKLLSNEPIDLLTFNPQLPSFSSGVLDLFGMDLLASTGLSEYLGYPLTIPLQAQFSAEVIPRLSFGIDTGGVIEASNLPDGTELFSWDVVKALTNGFYINDQYWVGGQLQDLPELSINMNLDGLAGIFLGQQDYFANLYASLGTGLDFEASLDLANAGDDGKVRLGNLLVDLFTQPTEVLDLNAQLDWYIEAKAGGGIDLSPTNWGPVDNAAIRAFVGALSTAANWTIGTDQFQTEFAFKYTQPLFDDNPDTEAPRLVDWVLGLA
jgi:hypothetical protein